MSALVDFLDEHVGEHRVLGRPDVTGASRVVHIEDSSGARWYAKRLVTDRTWQAEMRGYALWGHLAQVPTPRAVCSARQCLLVPEVTGRQPSGQSRRVLRAAGQVLRTLHDVPPTSDWRSGWRAVAEADTDRRLVHLARAGVRVNETLVRERVSALVAITGVADVATHGDYQPHNWRWRRGRLGVFDFASSGLRPAAYDIGRLRYAATWQRPELSSMLMDGYGRDLSAAEERFVQHLFAWRAVVGISIGLRQNRTEMVEHGHLVLQTVKACGGD